MENAHYLEKLNQVKKRRKKKSTWNVLRIGKESKKKDCKAYSTETLKTMWATVIILFVGLVMSLSWFWGIIAQTPIYLLSFQMVHVHGNSLGLASLSSNIFLCKTIIQFEANIPKGEGSNHTCLFSSPKPWGPRPTNVTSSLTSAKPGALGLFG